MAKAHERFGRIDILINNVGGTIWAKPFADYKVAEIEAEIRRSLFPTMWCCHAVLPYFVQQGHGTIVNVSSVATRGVNRVPYADAGWSLRHPAGSTHPSGASLADRPPRKPNRKHPGTRPLWTRQLTPR